MTTKRNKPKIAGEILPSGKGDSIAISGETLAEALDIDTWDVVEDTIPKRTLEDQDRALEEADEIMKIATSRSSPKPRI